MKPLNEIRLDVALAKADAIAKADASGVSEYYVQFDATDTKSGAKLVNRSVNVDASTKAEAEAKARKKAEGNGMTITYVKNIRTGAVDL